jgi:hypothetical protein
MAGIGSRTQPEVSAKGGLRLDRLSQDNYMAAAERSEKPEPFHVIVGSDNLPAFLGPFVDLDFETGSGSCIDNSVFVHRCTSWPPMITRNMPFVENS